jgi:hypothetical protein
VRRLNNFLLAFLPAFLLTILSLAATPHIDTNRTRLKAKEALQFCKKQGFNARYCFLVDMSLPSGVKRFVIWEFTKNQILTTGLVSHGCGQMPWSGMWSKDKPVFSNADGSHCTALGKYRIDGRAYSNWGIHVKYCLAGLESTNSNALKRQVVFHSWETVAEDEVYPGGTPEGWGCPAISNNTMKIADALIRKQKGHLLMWIYN